jgi:hypothetical protein
MLCRLSKKKSANFTTSMYNCPIFLYISTFLNILITLLIDFLGKDSIFFRNNPGSLPRTLYLNIIPDNYLRKDTQKNGGRHVPSPIAHVFILAKGRSEDKT